jgi:hypothetical protein
MGLAICRKIAQRHGGDITATSAPGHGASFLVSLPLSRADKPVGVNARGDINLSNLHAAVGLGSSLTTADTEHS